MGVSLNPNRAAWVRARYRSDMASGIAALPPDSKRDIRLYYLTSADHGISNIALRRVKVARFSDLNDPFELLGASFSDQRNRKVISDFKSATNEATGLVCFSEDWADPVLWSHYADRHKGMCLGFDVNRKLLQKVRYEAKRLTVALDACDDPNQLPKDLQRALMSTKYKSWKYERERRLFVDMTKTEVQGVLNFLPMDPELRLREVILGASSALSLRTMRGLVERSGFDAVVFRARLMYKGFRIVPKEKTIDPRGWIPELRDEVLRSIKK